MRVDPLRPASPCLRSPPKPYQIPRAALARRPSAARQYVIHGSGFDGPLVGSVQHVGDDADDGREADPASKERRCCFFVRRIVNRGHAATGYAGLPGQLDRGKTSVSNGSNSQLDAVWKSQAAAAPLTRRGQPSANEIGSFMSGDWPGRSSNRR